MLGLFQSGREKVERIEGEGKIVIEFNCVFVFLFNRYFYVATQ